jgi:hypothetical protein
MLMSVTERYKEIGTMKCLGALDNFIVKVFPLIESDCSAFFERCLVPLSGAVRYAHSLGRGFNATSIGSSSDVHRGVCIALGTC